MPGITDFNALLENIAPEIQPGDYVFCSVNGDYRDYAHLAPLASFREAEGLTLVLSPDAAEEAGLTFSGIFKQITLNVHSSLDAVGLTAAVATKLASHGISANIMAGYYHDHIFVQAEKAGEALSLLRELSTEK